MLTLSSLSRLFRRTHAESTALPNAVRGGARQATTWRLIGVRYFGSLSSDSNEKPSLLLQLLWRGQNCWEPLSPLHCSCMAQNRASHRRLLLIEDNLAQGESRSARYFRLKG